MVDALKYLFNKNFAQKSKTNDQVPVFDRTCN